MIVDIEDEFNGCLYSCRLSAVLILSLLRLSSFLISRKLIKMIKSTADNLQEYKFVLASSRME
jgi:hypothetical protein